MVASIPGAMFQGSVSVSAPRAISQPLPPSPSPPPVSPPSPAPPLRFRLDRLAVFVEMTRKV